MANSKKDLIITPNLCKTARSLLNWKQEDLAQKSEVALATIGSFEREERIPHSSTLKALRATFEEMGIEFENDERACGVRLVK